jgi:RNA polymerase sigma-70 factor (ECF subfamily)
MKPTKRAEAEMQEHSIEPDDFEWIVVHHQKRVFRTLLFLVRDADAAETLTQECFLRAFRNRGRFRGESNVATWLVRIAINLAHDHNRNRRWAFWRKLARTDRIDAIRIPSAQRSPEQLVAESEMVAAIRSAVERLPERQKTVFLLRFVEDMALEAISEAMNLELGTVKTHLYRAIDAVKSACAKGK